MALTIGEPDAAQRAGEAAATGEVVADVPVEPPPQSQLRVGLGALNDEDRERRCVLFGRPHGW
jgi:hypothetical protein